jgi:hypothetical protein
MVNDMNTKLSKLILPSIAIGVLLIPTFHSIAMASPGEHCDQKQMSPEKMHEHMKARLDKLAERLEIKSSQQAAWEEYATSVEHLVERSVKKPNDDADAATISRYRADRATEFAKTLNGIAEATAKLQKVLTDDQRKIFNQASRGFLHEHHGWHGQKHEQGREGHEWGQHLNSDREGHHDEYHKDSW